MTGSLFAARPPVVQQSLRMVERHPTDTMTASDGTPPGTRLGPYEVLSALGAGDMGEVYRARATRS
ncbi:MAG TPA: hypothetical protein VFO14_24550 [Vicinamibacterales bacterium]|nr:hypothetical protein [Vicinamibacterales bacterium]